MSMNGKTKTLRTTQQDYMNLLYSDSDSDDRIPDLKLPPIKGKKQRRKRHQIGRPDENGCGFLAVVKFILVLVTFVTLVTLAGLSFWSLKQIRELQEQIEELQASNKEPAGLINLQSQLAAVNSSVMNMKMGKGSLDEMASNIKVIKDKLGELEKVTADLTKSISSSKDFVDLPKKFQSLEVVVGGIGSDVKDTQNQQETKNAAYESRLANLETSVGALSSTAPSPASPDVDSQLGEMLRGELSAINNTLSMQVANLSNKVDAQSARISTLESFTQSVNAPNKEAIDTLVTKLVEEKMAKTSPVADPSAEGNSSYESELEELSKQVATMSEKIGKMGPNTGDFLLLKENTFHTFEDLNATILVMNEELAQLSHHVTLIDTAVINITSAMGIADPFNLEAPASTTHTPALSKTITQAPMTHGESSKNPPESGSSTGKP